MRRSFTLFSIVVHAIVISAALLAQVSPSAPYLIPHQPILYEAATPCPSRFSCRNPARGRGQHQHPVSASAASGPTDRRDRRNRT
jgi:hypothetical protein